MAAKDVPIANHLTTRNGVCQYVRRVPEDLRDAFPFERVQKSLGTRDKRRARAEALTLDQVWDARFAEARQRKGLIVGADGPAPLGTEGWTWPDWQALATWFGASLTEEDWRARLGSVTGAAFAAEPELAHRPQPYFPPPQRPEIGAPFVKERSAPAHDREIKWVDSWYRVIRQLIFRA